MLLTLVVLCFALSGFAALLYQSAWLQLFSLALGTSELAVAIVLAAYMAGLALGAAVAARFADSIQRPLFVYGMLEGAIGVSAIALPYFVKYAGDIYVWAIGNQPAPPDASTVGQPLFYCASAFLLLLPPTALMGATLPLLARYVVTSNLNLGLRVSMLYSLNTFGAAGGTLAAGFILLPTMGLRATAWTGVVSNLAVFLIVVWLSQRFDNSTARPAPNTKAKDVPMVGVTFILPLIALSGGLSFVYEILWMRMLTLVLGSSIYAFSTMLAAFLIGIALGGLGAGYLASTPRSAALFFAKAQFAIAIASWFAYSILDSPLASTFNVAALAFAVILPSTIFIGATYPLAVRAAAARATDAGHTSAAVYSFNTVGAIVGALLGGFYIVPGLGFDGTAQAAVAGNVLVGLATIFFAARVKAWVSVIPTQIAASLFIAIAILGLFRPVKPDGLLSRPIFGHNGEGRADEVHSREQYYAVGRSSTVYLSEVPTGFTLTTNGLPEAQIDFKGAPPTINSQRWLGLWPVLVRPETKSMLVVGLGGGIVLEGVPDSVQRLHVVELEPEVIRANAAVSERRYIDPLRDPRLEFIINDARNALRLTEMQYDAIVSQPSHPWAPGAAPLFTQEFFALVNSRLTERGVFVQWMNAGFLDDDLLRSFAATLLSEFRFVEVYRPSPLDLHFIASDSPVNVVSNHLRQWQHTFGRLPHLARNGIISPLDILATLTVDHVGINLLAEGSVPITDNHNRMAVHSNVLGTGISTHALTNLLTPFDPLMLRHSWLRRVLSDQDLVRVGLSLAHHGQLSRMSEIIDTIEVGSTRQVFKALLLRRSGAPDEARAILKTIGPDSSVFAQAVFLSVIDDLPWIASGDLDADTLPRFDGDDSTLKNVLTGWRLLARQEWQQLRLLDGHLRDTNVEELWVPYAAQLRAEWRLNANGPSDTIASEALQIIDSVIATHPTLGGYSVRARLGLELGDLPVFVESVAFVIDHIQKDIDVLRYAAKPLADAKYASVTRRLDLHAEQLRGISAKEATGRAGVLLSKIDQLVNLIENLHDEGDAPVRTGIHGSSAHREVEMAE